MEGEEALKDGWRGEGVMEGALKVWDPLGLADELRARLDEGLILGDAEAPLSLLALASFVR